MSTLIINIDSKLKNEFKKTCKEMGVNMTDVIMSSIIKFTEKSKSQTTKK